MPPPVVRQSGDPDSELPVVALQSFLIDGLHGAPASRCREVLRSAGLLSEVVSGRDSDDPRGWILAVQDLLHELTVLEDHRDGLVCRDDRLMIRDAPLWAWLLPPVLPLLGFSLAGLGNSVVVQLLSVLLTIVVPVGLWSVGVVVAYGIAQRRRRDRREDLQATKRRIIETRASLMEGASSILARDFVARAGYRLLVCTPALVGADDVRVAAWLDELKAYQIDPPDQWVDLDFSGQPPQP